MVAGLPKVRLSYLQFIPFASPEFSLRLMDRLVVVRNGCGLRRIKEVSSKSERDSIGQ